MKGLLFTYALTYGGAAVALFNPFFGLLIYVCFAIIKPEFMWYWSVEPGNFSRIIAIAMLVGWALQGFGSWQVGRGRAVMLAFVAFWSWAVLSMLLRAFDQAAAWHFVEGMAKILLPFLVGMTTIDSLAKLKQLAWIIMGSQAYVAYELNLSYYAGYNRVLLGGGFGGLDNNSVAIAMVTGTALAFFLGLHARQWWQKGLALVSALLMTHVVFFSFSRGGMLALCLASLVAFVLIPKRAKHYAVYGLVLLAALRLAGPDVRERFFSVFVDPQERDTSAQSRLELWADCWDVMKRRPLLGVGPDHWPLVAGQYGWPAGKEAHSLWMQTGAELGLPGLAFLLAFYGICVWRLWPLARHSARLADPWFGDVARMVIASIVGFALAAQFVSLEALEIPYYVVLVGAGALKLSSQTAAVPALEGQRLTVSQAAFLWPARR